MEKYVFWNLPYWRTLHVWHALDGLHITKNITESLLGTLMQLKGKGKESLQCHMDLEAMGVRAELRPLILPDGKKKLSVASWLLQTKGQREALMVLPLTKSAYRILIKYKEDSEHERFEI
jgi:hypothetical protein